MASFIREGHVSAELSETFAGYWAYLITVWNDGREEERAIPFRTKDEALDCVESFISGSFNEEK